MLIESTLTISSVVIASVITVVSCFRNLKESLLVSVFSSIVFIILARSELSLALPALAMFNAIPAVSNFFKSGVADERNAMDSKLKATTEDYKKLISDYSSSKEITAALSRSATEMEHLYEITRKMSEALEFNTIFRTFNEFLNRGIRFGECRLLIISRENDNLFIEKAYRMGHPLSSDEKGLQVIAPELKDEITLDLFYEDQRPQFLSQERDADRLRQFYGRQDIRTLASNPLIVEDELIGILILEDLVEKDLEKFLILAGQFAMEIKKVRLYETIQKLAIIDGLTGVYMRRHFLERFDEEVRRAGYHKVSISFLMVDIDRFKQCNDRYGHLVGDVVLTELAGILKKNVREIDILCRYGGEEFAIALPETDKQAAVNVAERIRAMVDGCAFRAFDETPRLTVSIGVAAYPEDANDMHALIEAADRALYTAKQTGRNKVCAFSAKRSKERLT